MKPIDANSIIQETQKAYISTSKSEFVDAEKVAKILDAEKAFVIGNKISLFRIPPELAEELGELIEIIAPNEKCAGYAVVNGESIVFKKAEEKIIAFVDNDKIIGSLRRLEENV